MKLFNHKNPKHLQILKEELTRAKKILNEEYSADRIWDSMSPEDRKAALYVAKAADSDTLVDANWDDVPADVQDLVDLGNYELAIDDKFSRAMLRGIKSALQSNPNAKQFVDKFLRKIGRTSIESITIDQATKLNKGIHQFLGHGVIGTQSTSTYNPREMPSGAPSKNRDSLGGMYTGD